MIFFFFEIKSVVLTPSFSFCLWTDIRNRRYSNVQKRGKKYLFGERSQSFQYSMIGIYFCTIFHPQKRGQREKAVLTINQASLLFIDFLTLYFNLHKIFSLPTRFVDQSLFVMKVGYNGSYFDSKILF